MGSFSKTFASNGGFVATNSASVKQFLSWFSPSFTFSNALSPIQASVVREAVRIVRSSEGKALRAKLLSAVNGLRDALTERRIEVMGIPSPIVPVLLGNEAIARIATTLCFSRGLFTNLVEFPAVPVDKVRFRMQVMANHTAEQGVHAAEIIRECLDDATELYQNYAKVMN
jgi:glycine C-acetyltransferase/8-amino-7-oxononanoate synthase